MRFTRIVTGALNRADSIEKLAILTVGNPGNLLQVSRYVISSWTEFGDERWTKWMRY